MHHTPPEVWHSADDDETSQRPQNHGRGNKTIGTGHLTQRRPYRKPHPIITKPVSCDVTEPSPSRLWPPPGRVSLYSQRCDLWPPPWHTRCTCVSVSAPGWGGGGGGWGCILDPFSPSKINLVVWQRQRGEEKESRAPISKGGEEE